MSDVFDEDMRMVVDDNGIQVQGILYSVLITEWKSYEHLLLKPLF